MSSNRESQHKEAQTLDLHMMPTICKWTGIKKTFTHSGPQKEQVGMTMLPDDIFLR